VAKRRKVANLLALAVLTTVMTKPMHPYEIASVLRARGKDQDIPIKWGSLYRVVQNLSRHGLLRPTQSERRGGRPERTVYEITDDGRAEVVDWVSELIAQPELGAFGFKAGLSFLAVLPPDVAADLLGQRTDALQAQVTADRARLAAVAAEIPRLLFVESEFDLAVREAELAWARGLLTEISQGSLPGLAQWREFYRTGQMPGELVKLAERGTDPS
jgi:DNA-binding PadR family transcriptional regulator